MVDAPVPAEFERGHRSGEVMELSLSSSEMESSKTSKSSEIQLHIQQLVKNYASKLAQLDVTNPEVLRTTHAFCAFQGCAKALRVQCDGDFFHKSFKNDKISTFWSHSWHGAQWKKILTLLSFYNGFAAVFCGFLAAILMMILFCLGFLPSLDRQFAVEFSVWCLPSGFAASTLVMLFWKNRTKVFLDRICISQNNDSLKVQAILSLAGLLKNSDVMLILWDPTWTQRLWCLFELAAYLKSKNTGKQALIVRPIFLGPISIAIFLVSCAIALPLTTVSFTDPTVGMLFVLGPAFVSGITVAYPTIWTLRGYFRDLDIMKEQLLRISFDATKSSCCDANHQSPCGGVLMCDRLAVKECVKMWFGSQEAFEHAVRTEVLDILNIVLSEKVFTTTWILGVTSPFLWAFLDLSASFAIVFDFRQFWLRPSVTLFVEGLMLWLVALPSAKDVAIMICRFTRAKGRTQCLELLKNLMVVFACALVLSVFLALYFGTRFAGQEFERAVAWSGGVVFFSICFHLGTVAMKMILKDSDGKCSSAHSVFGKAEGSNSLDRWAMSKRVLQKRHGKTLQISTIRGFVHEKRMDFGRFNDLFRCWERGPRRLGGRDETDKAKDMPVDFRRFGGMAHLSYRKYVSNIYIYIRIHMCVCV